MFQLQDKLQGAYSLFPSLGLDGTRIDEKVREDVVRGSVIGGKGLGKCWSLSFKLRDN